MDTKKAEAIQAAKDALDTKAATLQAAIDAKVAKADIVDNLTDGGTDKVLSAEQGKVLKGLIDGKTSVTVKDALDSDSTTEALSAKQGKELKTALDTVSEKVNLIETVTKYFEVEFNGEKEKEATNTFFKANSVVDFTFLGGDTAGRILTYVEDGKVTIKSDENETGKFAIYVTSKA
jgi:phage pre-neck appendage-like protein